MGRCLIVGVLNCTPDSFSDGGKLTSAKEAIETGVRMAGEGADWIDVGGESTRPGSQTVSGEEERARAAAKAAAEKPARPSIFAPQRPVPDKA